MWEILTNLTFDKPVAVALAVLPALLNFYILYYINRRLQKEDTSRTLAFAIRALIIWQMRDCMFRLSKTAETAYYWDNILSSGYLVFAPLSLLFALKYTCHHRLARKIGVLFLLFLPPLIFQSVYSVISRSAEYYYSPFWGWNCSYNETLVGRITVVWIFLCGLITCGLLVLYAWKSRHVPVLNMQSFLLASSRCLLWLLAFFGQFYLPQVLNKPVVPITSTTIVIFSLAVIIGMHRYRLFQTLDTPGRPELEEKHPVAELTISPDPIITHANAYAGHMLDIYPEDQHIAASTIVYNEPINRQKFNDLISECLAGKLVSNKEVILLYGKDRPMPAVLSANPVYKAHILEEIVIVWRSSIPTEKTNTAAQVLNK